MKQYNTWNTMSLLKLIITVCLITGNLFAADYPTTPKNCFEDSIYCSNTSIHEITVNGNEHTAIKANFFAVLSCDDFSSVNKVIEQFVAFDELGENFTDSETMRLTSSIGLEPLHSNGEKILPHYAAFYVKAPWPLKWLRVRELTHYKRISQNEVTFKSIVDKNHKIRDEEILHGSEGFKYKSGKLRVDLSKENCQYNVTFSSTTVPTVEILPQISSGYLEAGMIELLTQIFLLQ